MPMCPFAKLVLITGGVGPYVGGPFKIVHHTTEGSTKEGAFSAYQRNRSDPHFTVDHTGIFQHIDTAIAARALRNLDQGVQTNKDSALQIEVVAFAHLPKNGRTLANVARLCRWLESTHNVPRVWPNGIPKMANGNGGDPGGHNRNPMNWDTKGGHYGHCHVPENDHWDPGYSLQEVKYLTEATFEAGGEASNIDYMMYFYNDVIKREDDVNFANAVSSMEHEDNDPDRSEYDRY